MKKVGNHISNQFRIPDYLCSCDCESRDSGCCLAAHFSIAGGKIQQCTWCVGGREPLGCQMEFLFSEQGAGFFSDLKELYAYNMGIA